MRLLLDEHYSREVAEQLRRRGHDVVAVDERDELRGLGDPELLDVAAGERRAVVTENVTDFSLQHERWLAAGRSHHGIVLATRKRVPRERIGAVIAALDRFLRTHPRDDELVGLVVWLEA